MIVLGLDQAPVGIGYAYGEPGSVPTFGFHSNPSYGDNTAKLGEHVRDWLCTFIKSAGIEVIYFEQVIVRKFGLNINTFWKQATVVCNIEAAASLSGLGDQCWMVNIADWRKSFYAGRKAPRGDEESDSWKSMALTECARRNIYVENHNVAEAIGIWDHGCRLEDKRYRVRSRVDTRRQEMLADEARRAG